MPLIDSTIEILKAEAGIPRNLPGGSISDINSVRLCEMLDSDENPLLKRHRLIMQFANQVELFDKI